ncbi:transmembrane 14C [Babesia ovata]|uniref:Transmembrane 14C n=1 Tax=Babesia ovata TaxID=189622 RepID=A0A2H6K792_9APIC|nr:transmembrane 14C [Babesia ovata]GBE58861.1 transmembrane 14C [Babesia ovata]
MIAIFVVPAILCSGFFMGGGVYAYVVKRSAASLLASAAISGAYAGCTYVMLARPSAYIGFCLATTTSILALGLGCYKLFVEHHSTTAKRNVAVSIYSTGLASTCFYIAVLFAKKFLVPSDALSLRFA